MTIWFSIYSIHFVEDRKDIRFDKRITLGERRRRAGNNLQKYYIMKRSQWKRRIWALVLAGLIAGCAQLPEYARPRFHEPRDGSAHDGKGFRYRALSIEDFQAPDLPPEYDNYNHHINAHSCISIRPSETSRVRITQGVYGGHMFFVGSFPEAIFEAVFVPACSWWNPEIPAKRRDYVLQHEQIHFAIAELAARRLTRDAREELKDYLAINTTYQAVQDELRAKLEALTRDAIEASFEEHTDFDEDTSLRYDPRAQHWWLEEVQERLAEEKSTEAK
jgi:hypothetical protein